MKQSIWFLRPKNLHSYTALLYFPPKSCHSSLPSWPAGSLKKLSFDVFSTKNLNTWILNPALFCISIRPHLGVFSCGQIFLALFRSRSVFLCHGYCESFFPPPLFFIQFLILPKPILLGFSSFPAHLLLLSNSPLLCINPFSCAFFSCLPHYLHTHATSHYHLCWGIRPPSLVFSAVLFQERVPAACHSDKLSNSSQSWGPICFQPLCNNATAVSCWMWKESVGILGYELFSRWFGKWALSYLSSCRSLFYKQYFLKGVIKEDGNRRRITSLLVVGTFASNEFIRAMHVHGARGVTLIRRSYPISCAQFCFLSNFTSLITHS